MPVSLLVRVMTHCLRTSSLVVFDLARLASLAIRSHTSLAAENLFLRKQLALFQERKVKPRRADDATRWWMATLGRMFQWRNALVSVKPNTLIRWQRRRFRLFWRWKSKPSMANCQIGLSAAVFEVLIPLPECATSLSYSFI